MHEAALAAGKLTRVWNRGSAYPSEVIMSRCYACSYAREEEATDQRARCHIDQHPEKRGAHEYPTRSNVQPAEVPEGDDARGNRRASWLASQMGGREATARDEEDQAGPGAEHLSGPPVGG
jgi:hypothetical protein